MILLSILLCSFVATATAGRVQTLTKSCSRPCTSATKIQDCTDNWGRVGTLPSKDATGFPFYSFVKSNEALCGNVECIDGFCSMNATRRFLDVLCSHEYCDNDDAKCDAGPHDLDYEGTCSLWYDSDKAYMGCNYRWCPPEEPIEQDIILPFEPEDPLDWRVPRTCPNGGCTTDADCIDPEGIYGVIPPIPGVTPESLYHVQLESNLTMNSACGHVRCKVKTGLCKLEPLQDVEPKYECGFMTTNCTGDGQCHGAAPAYPVYKQGYCPVSAPGPKGPNYNGIIFVPGPRICSYHWCPPATNVASTTTITTSTATAVADTTTTVTTATSTTANTATTTTAAASTRAAVTTATAMDTTATATDTTATVAADTTTTATTTTTTTNTLSQSTSTSGVVTQICCNDASDCVADPGKTNLASCGEVKCQSNRCIFNAYEDSGECGKEYFVWCDSKHDLCVKGPQGSKGRCTHYHNQECSYEWCPGPRTTAAVATTTTKPTSKSTKAMKTTTSAVVVKPGKTCCIDSSDCVADSGKTSLASCGEVKCQNNRCVFDAYIDSGKCGKEYFVWCEGKHDLCVKGPGGSAGRCTIFDDQECSYEWCPGLKQDS